MAGYVLRSNLRQVTWMNKLVVLTWILVVTGALCLLQSASAATFSSNHKSTTPTVHKTASKGKKSKKNSKGSWKTKGQQKIDGERTRQIQQALMREHYLAEGPSGMWDVPTEDAMRRYQADHGWQDKSIPDSRALIKLGLGPDHGHLLNPESAMTSEPASMHAPSSIPATSSPVVPASSAPITPVSSDTQPPK